MAEFSKKLAPNFGSFFQERPVFHFQISKNLLSIPQIVSRLEEAKSIAVSSKKQRKKIAVSSKKQFFPIGEYEKSPPRPGWLA